MRAVICNDFNSSEIRDISRPELERGEVLIEVERVQLSVTECKLFKGNQIAHYETVRNRIEAGDGRLFGHEFCGQIVEVGPGVASFQKGDRVYAPGKLPCFDCLYCDRGYSHLCNNKQSIGYDFPGALAEYVALPTVPLAKLPEDVSNKEGAAMQPLASALLCMIDAGINPGDVVAIVGTGVMGYQCGQLAKRLGAGKVFAVDIRTKPLKHAVSQGMEPVNATEINAVEQIQEATGGVGADVVVEAAGGDQDNGTSGNGPLAQSFQAVRRGGVVIQVGHIIGNITVQPRTLRSKYVNWVNPWKGVISMGPNMTTGEFAAKLVADGSVSITEFITHELDGLDSFEHVVDMTINKDKYGTLGPVQIVVDHS